MNELMMEEMSGMYLSPMMAYREKIVGSSGDTSLNNLNIKMVVQDSEKKEILDRISNFTLSDDVQYFADEYARVFNIRNEFLWKWLGVLYGEKGVTLSSVDKIYYDSITDTKIILTIAFSMLDDLSELHKDKELVEQLIGITKNLETDVDIDDERLVFFKKIWGHFLSKIKQYPRYEEFRDIFWYDFNQMLNSVQYNMLVSNNPEMMNVLEMKNYDCHNMIVFLLNGIDLMVSPSFNKQELSRMRTAFWHAQQMARIGNWLSTWKRELKERDICSGVFAYAFSQSIIDVDDVGQLDDDKIIERIEQSGMHAYFMRLWKENYMKLLALRDKITSVNMDSYIHGLENCLKSHMASEGLK